MAKDTSPATAADGTVPLTPRDVTILTVAITKCTKEAINIDYAKLADAVGLASANSAKASWHSVKKKVDRGVAAFLEAKSRMLLPDPTAGIITWSCADVLSGGDAGEAAADGDDGQPAAETKKATKGKGTKRKAAAAVEPKVQENEDGEAEAGTQAVKSPVKKKARKTAAKKGEAAAVEGVEDAVVKAEDEDGEAEAVKKAPAKKGKGKGKKAKAADPEPEAEEEEDGAEE